VNTFKQVAEKFVSDLSWKQLATLRDCISARKANIIIEALRLGTMEWANDEEMRLCRNANKVKAIKLYRIRTRKPATETTPSWEGYYTLAECKAAIDATWRVYEVASFVIDYLKEGKPGDRVTFFNILDAHLNESPRGFEYEELRDALNLLLQKQIIGEEVPEGDITKTTDIWLLDWNKVAIV